ncbi:MAG: hypothetical protein OEY51_01910, partial [Cyclobacteriaceae bacterium]|nr:hypothetical protein [Cyclobacteriaceae bacterium]
VGSEKSIGGKDTDNSVPVRLNRTYISLVLIEIVFNTIILKERCIVVHGLRVIFLRSFPCTGE